MNFYLRSLILGFGIGAGTCAIIMSLAYSTISFGLGQWAALGALITLFLCLSLFMIYYTWNVFNES